MVRISGIKRPFDLFVARVMKTIAYLRVSTGSQDLANQKLAVLDYARQKRFAIDHFVEAQVSSRKGAAERRVEESRRARGRPRGASRNCWAPWRPGTVWSSASCHAWAAAWARSSNSSTSW